MDPKPTIESGKTMEIYAIVLIREKTLNHINKIFQQSQTHRTAFFWMELNPVRIIVPDRGGKWAAVRCGCESIVRRGISIIRVHEIYVFFHSKTLKERVVRALKTDGIPAHMGHFHARNRWKFFDMTRD